MMSEQQLVSLRAVVLLLIASRIITAYYIYLSVRKNTTSKRRNLCGDFKKNMHKAHILRLKLYGTVGRIS